MDEDMKNFKNKWKELYLKNSVLPQGEVLANPVLSVENMEDWLLRENETNRELEDNDEEIEVDDFKGDVASQFGISWQVWQVVKGLKTSFKSLNVNGILVDSLVQFMNLLETEICRKVYLQMKRFDGSIFEFWLEFFPTKSVANEFVTELEKRRDTELGKGVERKYNNIQELLAVDGWMLLYLEIPSPGVLHHKPLYPREWKLKEMREKASQGMRVRKSEAIDPKDVALVTKMQTRVRQKNETKLIE
eukprot:3937323-Rhodomonas_salina.1